MPNIDEASASRVIGRLRTTFVHKPFLHPGKTVSLASVAIHILLEQSMSTRKGNGALGHDGGSLAVCELAGIVREVLSLV